MFLTQVEVHVFMQSKMLCWDWGFALLQKMAKMRKEKETELFK